MTEQLPRRGRGRPPKYGDRARTASELQRAYVQRERERVKQFRFLLARVILIAGVEMWGYDFGDDDLELLKRELKKARRHGHDPEIEDAIKLLERDAPDSWREDW